MKRILVFFLFFFHNHSLAKYSNGKTFNITVEPIELLKLYVSYYLYHEISQPGTNSHQICLPDENLNKTLHFINQKIVYCSNPNYFPRILSASQVTFKKVDPEEQNSQKVHKNRTSRSNSSSSTSSSLRKMKKFQNRSWSLQKNHSNSTLLELNTSISNVTQDDDHFGYEKEKDTLDHENNSNNDDNDDDEKTVHKYLLFVLVIPKHPFSRELIQAIQIIAPMFPSVTIYFGISYEFSELCAQYSVKSFPKILFFHNGLLIKKYHSTNPVTLAVRIAEWIGKFPESNPIPLLSTLQQSSSSLPTYYNYNSSWFAVPKETGDVDSFFNKFLQSLDQILTSLSAGRSVEPLIAFSPKVTRWDFEIFTLSILYSISRAVWQFRKWWIKRSRGTSGVGGGAAGAAEEGGDQGGTASIEEVGVPQLDLNVR